WYLDELIENRPSHFQRQYSPDVLGGVERTEHDLSFDVPEPQPERLVVGDVLARHPVGEPGEPRLQRGVHQLRQGVADDHPAGSAYSVHRRWSLQLCAVDDLEQDGRGLRGANRPYDEREEPIVQDELFGYWLRRVVDAQSSSPLIVMPRLSFWPKLMLMLNPAMFPWFNCAGWSRPPQRTVSSMSLVTTFSSVSGDMIIS